MAWTKKVAEEMERSQWIRVLHSVREGDGKDLAEAAEMGKSEIGTGFNQEFSFCIYYFPLPIKYPNGAIT